MKISIKWLVIFLTLILIIIFIVLIWLIFDYYKAEKQKENINSGQAVVPASLMTYHNKEYNFEFQYPDSWEIKENIYSSPASKFNLIIVPSEGKYLPDPILFNFTTQEFVDISFLNLDKYWKEIVVNNIVAKKYEYEYEGMKRISIIVPHKEYQVIIGAEREYENVFNQVLSTVNFLK